MRLAKKTALVTSAGRSWDAVGTDIPMLRQAQATEVASAAAFLAPDDASSVNSERLVVNGGLVCTL